MVTNVVTLNVVESVQTLLNTLTTSQHNGFPIVNRGENGQHSFIGLVLRSQVGWMAILLSFLFIGSYILTCRPMMRPTDCGYSPSAGISCRPGVALG